MTVTTKPLAERLLDPALERVRQNHEQRLTELQNGPLAGGRIIKNVSLPDAALVQVEHGLGRPPLSYFVGPPRFSVTGGVVRDWAFFEVDPSRFFVLQAVGMGATVQVDVLVF